MSDPQKPDENPVRPEDTPTDASDAPTDAAPPPPSSDPAAAPPQPPVAPPVPWAGPGGPAAPGSPPPTAAPPAAPTPPAQPTAAYPTAPVQPPQPPQPTQPTVAYGGPPAGSGGYPPAPGQPAAGSYAPPPKKGGLGLVALILGIVAIVTAFIPGLNYLTFFIAVAGLIVGIIALVKKRGSRGQSLTGTILSGVALILGPILAVVYTVAFVSGLAATTLPSALPSAFPSSEPSTEPSEDPSGEPSEDPSKDPGAAPSTTAVFTDTILFTDNLEMTVGEPAPYTLSETAVGGSQPENVVFDVTLTNNTTADFTPLVTVAMVSAGVDGEQIVDFGPENISLFGPTEPIPVGQTVTFRMGFNVTDPNDLQLEISPGIGYDNILFER